MENTTPVTVKNINQLLAETPPTKIATIPQVQEKFVQLVMKIQGQPRAVAEAIFHAESFHYLRVISDSPSLRECEPLSLYGCFVDMAVNGLSFDPTKKLSYMIAGNVNIGTAQAKNYVKRATLTVSPYGELAIRQRMGQIKYADNPIIVYKGDTFRPLVGEDGIKKVIYELDMTHTSEIVGAFIRIVRIDGSTDVHWMLQEDIKRLQGYSARKNRNDTGNALYNSENGGIDPGFLAAKMIKHAFRSYPKVKVAGAFTEVEKDDEPKELTHEELYETIIPGKQIEQPTVAAQLREATNTAQPIQSNVSDQVKMANLAATAGEEVEPQTIQFKDEDEY